MTVRVLFVCLGNICRSPTAEGVLIKKIADAGLNAHIEVDSAGTSDWHIGKAPDSRTVSAARSRQYDLSPLRARQLVAADLDQFDYVLAMDNQNLAGIRAFANEKSRAKTELFLAYASRATHSEVPDPYYGESDGFSLVLDLVEDAADGLIEHIRQHHLKRG